jgi:hypothetical protein
LLGGTSHLTVIGWRLMAFVGGAGKGQTAVVMAEAMRTHLIARHERLSINNQNAL